MKEKNLRTWFSVTMVATLACFLFAYQNCTKAGFNPSDATAKDSTLSSTTVFPPSSGTTGTSSGGSSGSSGSSSSGSSTGGTGDGTSSGSSSSSSMTVTENFSFLCSDARTVDIGENLVSVTAIKIDIVDLSGPTVACELTGDYRSQVLNSKSLTLDLSTCASLSSGKTYYAFVLGADKSLSTAELSWAQQNQINLFNYQNDYSGSGPFNALSVFSVSLNSSGANSTMPSSAFMLYDLNGSSNESNYSSLASTYGSTSTTQAQCNQFASPLMINLGAQAPLELTAPWLGILFDILGINATPAPHTPQQISWFPVDDQQEYYFLVLPDANGEVKGIDQMFGNNTVGPDGKTAANGYLALAKYDTNHDGYITAVDPIFSQLRLWKDSKHTGIAQASDLLTLQDKGVVAIDLNYNGNYQETDQWGNVSRYKSVVRTSDQKLHLIFDLWFVIEQASQH